MHDMKWDRDILYYFIMALNSNNCTNVVILYMEKKHCMTAL